MRGGKLSGPMCPCATTLTPSYPVTLGGGAHVVETLLKPSSVRLACGPDHGCDSCHHVGQELLTLTLTPYELADPNPLRTRQ